MTPPIRTRPDGTKYPLRGDGGGGKSAAPVVAVGVAVAVWAGSGGVLVSEQTAMSTAESAVVRNITKNLPKARQDVQRGKPAQAWQRLGLRKGVEEIHEAVECVVFSYGQVQQFFVQTPCRDLQRVQFPVSYEGGTMSVLVSRVRMHSTWDARRFRNVIDEDGTGDIRPVLPDARFTGHHYDSTRDKTTVFVAESEAITGDIPEPILDLTADVATMLARSATT